MSKRQSKQAQQVNIEQSATFVAVQNALESRAVANEQQASFFRKLAKLCNAHAVAALESANVDVSALASLISNSDKANANAFVAKYAVEKIVKIALAFAQDSFTMLDDYTQSIVLNARKLAKLNAKSALVCLSRDIEYTSDDAQQSVHRYKHCEATTASTQRSSTREALRVLNIAHVTKNKRDDAIEFADSDSARKMQALCDSVLQ